ncbi:MAG: hypothetical protein QM737_20390 [Ferruginibacter sp.]
MKKLLSILIIFLSLHVCGYAQQVEGLKQVFDITMDETGNADVEVSMKLNAGQWDMFKRNLGTNTSVLKREMEKALPKYFLSDFNYTEDQMERTYKMKFKVAGLAGINNNGAWEAKLDSKNPDITKLSDREFVMNANYMSNGGLIQQTQKIHLPSGASGAKIEKDSFGKAMLTYTTGGPLFPKIITYGGVALILLGGWMFYRNKNTPKNNLHVAPKEAVAA